MSDPIIVKPDDLVEIEITVRTEDSHGKHRKTAKAKIGFRSESGLIPKDTWDRYTKDQAEHLIQQLNGTP